MVHFSRFIGLILWKGWILDFVRPMNLTFRSRVLSNVCGLNPHNYEL